MMILAASTYVDQVLAIMILILVRECWVVLVRNSFEGLGQELYMACDSLFIPGYSA